MMREEKSYRIYVNLTFLLFSALLVYFTKDFPLYWDNLVQLSVPANYYYDTDFRHFFIPDAIATGHPTFVSMYFAGLWKLFGRSLLVSHIAMFPFIFGTLFQLRRFIHNLTIRDSKLQLIILIFLVADTTILAQLSLVTFDVIQLFLFFLCMNAILTKRRFLLSFYFLLLMLISLRSAMMAGGLVLFHFLYQYLEDKKIRLKPFIVYLPGIIALLLFLLAFKVSKGWMIHNTVSNKWADSGALASFPQMLRNAGIFIWRLIDLGRVGIFIAFGLIGIKMFFQKRKLDRTLNILLLIALGQTLVFFPIIVMYQNPFANRYFLVIMVCVSVFVVYWIYHNTTKKYLWLPLIFGILISGHFWLYPKKISQGFDATTLHWSYLQAYDEMQDFIESSKIDKGEIATFFPAYYPDKITYLKNGKDYHRTLTVLESDFILYSNALNVEDDVIEALFNENSQWIEVKSISKSLIDVTLYRRIK